MASATLAELKRLKAVKDAEMERELAAGRPESGSVREAKLAELARDSASVRKALSAREKGGKDAFDKILEMLVKADESVKAAEKGRLPSLTARGIADLRTAKELGARSIRRAGELATRIDSGLTTVDEEREALEFSKAAVFAAEEEKRIYSCAKLLEAVMLAQQARRSGGPSSGLSGLPGGAAQRRTRPLRSPLSSTLRGHSSCAAGGYRRCRHPAPPPWLVRQPRSRAPHAQVDIAFVLDCTGSMGQHMEAMKTEIGNIVSEVTRVCPDSRIRAGFVGHAPPVSILGHVTLRSSGRRPTCTLPPRTTCNEGWRRPNVSSAAGPTALASTPPKLIHL